MLACGNYSVVIKILSFVVLRGSSSESFPIDYWKTINANDNY